MLRRGPAARPKPEAMKTTTRASTTKPLTQASTAKPLLAFELSGEHEILPESEVLACMRALDIEHNFVKSLEQCLLLKISGDPFEISKRLSTRLAMTHHIVSVVIKCDTLPASILESVRAAEITVPGGETFSVRVKQIQGSFVQSTRMERLIGEVIFERNSGAKVDLSNPDHRFRVIVTKDSCVFGEVLASIDRRQFWDRLPHKKPFFYPGAISPDMARAIVNLCEIRTNDLVLDPFCGTGGILLEAGMIRARVLGIDAQESMVRGADMNLRSHGFEYQLASGDACNLPLKDGSVDAVVTDPPYGRSAVVRAESIESLYKNALPEIYRVMKVGGHAVVISDFELLCADEIGFVVTGLYKNRVHRSLTRYILVLRK
ncbi:MAG: RNA methyltransferase [Candidatus Methanogaster sp.]|uniref:RNA methyltransferase n=1 Tax=Candidatus Methanogaster sp. TaxID=3386292 RepID=A0AC61L1B2_9EURY|nr:MAG: RNA methyltransferase [ANME-2 cluster archaeon]